MRLHNLTYLLFVFFILGTLTTSFAQSPEQMYQKGLVKEEGEGNLIEAIDIYNKIVADKNADKSLQAKALLHVGLCYEKLGKKEAVKAYQKLVSNFSSHKNEVAIARERLSKLLPIAEEVTENPVIPIFTKIDIPTKLSWSVELSPNGKELALVSDKKLWVMPLSGNLGPNIPGTPVKLNTEEIEVEWTGLSWSRNNQLIAFNEIVLEGKPEKEKRNQSIYVIPSKGGKPRKIIENFRDARVVNYRLSLSPDAKNLAFSSVENNEQYIYTIPIEGETPKKLINMQAREPVYSPDGKWIAYVEDRNAGRGEGGLGLWVVSAQGGKSNLIANAGKASSLVWSPDGNMIAYLDYTKNKHIFVAEIDKTANAKGKVTAIDVPKGTEEIRLLAGWSPDNKIGMLLSPKQVFGLYTVPASGGQAAMILHDTYALQPRWSRDREQIYYITSPKEGENKMYRLRLAAVSSAGGKGHSFLEFSKDIPLYQLAFQSGNRLSYDGKMIVSAAWTSQDTSSELNSPKSKIWKIAVDGSKVVQITNTQGPYADGSPCWSPDGKKVAFVRVELQKSGMGAYKNAAIYSVDSSGGEPELLVSQSGKWANSLIWSPNGEMLAWLSQEQEDIKNKPSLLNVFNFSDGSTRIVGAVPTQHVNIETAWSPDSKRIAFNDGNGRKVIKVMNIEDGSIEDIETDLLDVKIHHLDWSPDGKKFVFGGMKGENKEFWFMENFLPLEKLTQKSDKSSEAEGIIIKQVWTGPDVEDIGSVSLDGNYLSFSDMETGNLATRNLKTNENQSLTNEGSWDDPIHYSDLNVISNDGKNVAYSWYVDLDSSYENSIRIVNLDSKSITNLFSARIGEDIFPYLWTKDNKKIAFQKFQKVRSNYESLLGLIDVESRAIDTLKYFEDHFITNVSLSKDDKYIAFDYPNPDNNGNFDINIISVKNKNEENLIKHPANDRLVGWLPERDEILFISDRSGTNDVWALNTSNLKTITEPKRILTNIGNISPLGFTKSGELYFSTRYRRFKSFTAPFNEKTRELSVDSKNPLLGSILDLCWLPDGESLLCYEYVQKPDKRWHHQLLFMDSKSGKHYTLAENINAQGPPRLSPDSSKVLLFGYDTRRENDKDYKGGIYVVDLKSGTSTEIKVNQDISRSHSVEWNRNGESIFYTCNNQIIEHNLATYEERVIFSTKDNLGRGFPILRRSFDGNSILFDMVDEMGEKENYQYLKSVDIESGVVKTIAMINTHLPLKYKKIALSPNGKYIYYTGDDPKEIGSILWRVPAVGGKPEKFWQSRNKIASISIHPDGDQMALSVYEQETEIRVVENLVREVDKIFNQNE